MWTNKNFTTPSTAFASQNEDVTTLIPVASEDEPILYEPIDTNVFINNKAFYANSVGSFPSYIKISMQDDQSASFINSDDDAVTEGRQLQSTLQSESLDDSQIVGSFRVVSGQSFSFEVAIYDQDDQVYTDDSSSIASLRFYPTVPVDSLIMGNQAIANKGVFYFDRVKINLKPGSQHYIQIVINNLPSYGN